MRIIAGGGISITRIMKQICKQACSHMHISSVKHDQILVIKFDGFGGSRAHFKK